MPCSIVQCSTVPYSTVQYRTAQYRAAQYRTVQYWAVQCSTVTYSTVQYSTVQYSAVPYSTVPCSAVQYSAVPCSTVPYSAVPYSAIQKFYSGYFAAIKWSVHIVTAALLWFNIANTVAANLCRCCCLIAKFHLKVAMFLQKWVHGTFNIKCWNNACLISETFSGYIFVSEGSRDKNFDRKTFHQKLLPWKLLLTEKPFTS